MDCVHAVWQCSMQQVTQEGLKPYQEEEGQKKRFAVERIHNAENLESTEDTLMKMVGGKTPQQIKELLRAEDVNVTNMKDKEKQLVVIEQVEQFVNV